MERCVRYCASGALWLSHTCSSLNQKYIFCPICWVRLTHNTNITPTWTRGKRIRKIWCCATAYPYCSSSSQSVSVLKLKFCVDNHGHYDPQPVCALYKDESKCRIKSKLSNWLQCVSVVSCNIQFWSILKLRFGLRCHTIVCLCASSITSILFYVGHSMVINKIILSQYLLYDCIVDVGGALSQPNMASRNIHSLYNNNNNKIHRFMINFNENYFNAMSLRLRAILHIEIYGLCVTGETQRSVVRLTQFHTLHNDMTDIAYGNSSWLLHLTNGSARCIVCLTTITASHYELHRCHIPS